MCSFLHLFACLRSLFCMSARSDHHSV
jgi:hypothetical protein